MLSVNETIQKFCSIISIRYCYCYSSLLFAIVIRPSRHHEIGFMLWEFLEFKKNSEQDLMSMHVTALLHLN